MENQQGSYSNIAQEVSIEAVVTRCGCGDPLRLHGRDEQGGLLPCPTPRAIEDKGTVSYWHVNPLKRLYFWWTGRKWS